MMRFLFATVLIAAVAPAGVAGPTVDVVIGSKAPPLEKLAADDLASTLKHVFGASVRVGDKADDGAEHVILVGSPMTNPAVKAAVAEDWPKLSDQGHVLKSVGGKLILGGGSPVATFWAVAEYGHSVGQRVMLHRIFSPLKASQFTTDGFDVTLEPNRTTRTWMMDLRPQYGPRAWTVAEMESLIGRLARLKVNVLRIIIDKKAMTDEVKFLIDGDTAGRAAFKGANEFINPDLQGTAIEPWVQKVTEVGRKYGLEVQLVGLYLPEPNRGDNGVGGSVLPVAAPSLRPDAILLDPVIVSDRSLDVYRLTRTAFGKPLTSKEAAESLYDPVFGPGVAEPLLKAALALEKATAVLKAHQPELTADLKTLLARVSVDKPAPETWATASKLYLEALSESLRAFNRSQPQARSTVFYLSKRSEFALGFMDALTNVRAAAQAKAKGDADKRQEHLEKAVESFYNALNAYGEAALDPSDRGLIAVLNAFVYKPLFKEANEPTK